MFTKNLAYRPEKIAIRERITKACKEWIFANRHSGGIVVSLPARYALMEMEILEYIQQLQKEGICKVKLITCDIKLRRDEIALPQMAEWSHYRENIFDVVARQDKQSMFVWFDLCGPLSDKNAEGLKLALPKMADGSQYYITLAVHGIRAGISELVRSVYHRNGNTPESNLQVTRRMVSGLNAKFSGCAEDPVYEGIYGVQMKFAVLGYNIKTVKTETMSLSYREIASLAQKIHSMEVEVEKLKAEMRAIVLTETGSSQEPSAKPSRRKRPARVSREERRAQIVEVFKREAEASGKNARDVKLSQSEIARRLGVGDYVLYNMAWKGSFLHKCLDNLMSLKA